MTSSPPTQNGAHLLVGADANDRIVGWELDRGTAALRPPLASVHVGAGPGAGGAEDLVLLPEAGAALLLLRGDGAADGRCEVRMRQQSWSA